jgi:hypothetical protein
MTQLDWLAARVPCLLSSWLNVCMCEGTAYLSFIRDFPTRHHYHHIVNMYHQNYEMTQQLFVFLACL